MSRGWNQVSNLNNPRGMWTTKVTRPMHPEMRDVEPGVEYICKETAKNKYVEK